MGFFLAYASPLGWAFIDRALYLLEKWAEDRDRCREAGVPCVRPVRIFDNWEEIISAHVDSRNI